MVSANVRDTPGSSSSWSARPSLFVPVVMRYRLAGGRLSEGRECATRDALHFEPAPAGGDDESNTVMRARGFRAPVPQSASAYGWSQRLEPTAGAEGGPSAAARGGRRPGKALGAMSLTPGRIRRPGGPHPRRYVSR